MALLSLDRGDCPPFLPVTRRTSPASQPTRASFSTMAEDLEYQNPPGVCAPLGPYSHGAVVPAGMELVFISGQIGVTADGRIGDSIEEQADQAFANLLTILNSMGLDASAIVKLTVLIVAGQDAEAVKAARLKHMGAHEPASTTFFVSGLLRSGWFIEVEAVAARRRTSK